MKEYMKLILDYNRSKIFITALKLDIFSHLEDEVDSDYIADKLSLDRRNTRFFLNALSSSEFIIKKNNKYKNTDKTNKYLNKSKKDYMGDYILFREQMSSLESLDKKLLKKQYKKINDGCDMYDFYELAKVTRKEMFFGKVQNILNLIGKIFNKDQKFKVLDLGGGSGTFAIEIAKKYKNSQTFIFERDNVTPIAKEIIKNENDSDLEKRTHILEGDFNSDEIGKNYDFIIASGIMDFAGENIQNLSDKIYNSMNKKSYVYLVTHGVNENYTKPEPAIIGWLSGQINGLDILTCERKIIDSFFEAGFNKIEKLDEKEGFLNSYLIHKD